MKACGQKTLGVHDLAIVHEAGCQGDEELPSSCMLHLIVTTGDERGNTAFGAQQQDRGETMQA
jgi:hypothetical protein